MEQVGSEEEKSEPVSRESVWPSKQIRVFLFGLLSAAGGVAASGVVYSFKAGQYFTEHSTLHARLDQEVQSHKLKLEAFDRIRESHTAAINQADRSLTALTIELAAAQKERREDFNLLNRMVYDIRESMARIDAKLAAMIEHQRKSSVFSIPQTGFAARTEGGTEGEKN